MPPSRPAPSLRGLSGQGRPRPRPARSGLRADQRPFSGGDRHLRRERRAWRRLEAALAASEQHLQRETRGRLAAQQALRRSRKNHRHALHEARIMQRDLRRLTHQVLSAQEEERKIISRELHDEIGQTLVGINVELAALGRGARSDLRARILRTQRLVTQSVEAVHRFARDLRPAVLDDLGLIPALRAYCRGLVARRHLKIHLLVCREVETLDASVRTVLFRVAQEALTNVVRHARATRVRVSLIAVPGGIRLGITDDGRAFDVDRALRPRGTKRLGLIGMKERLEMIGGTFAIISRARTGTTVRAEVPRPIPTQAP